MSETERWSRWVGPEVAARAGRSIVGASPFSPDLLSTPQCTDGPSSQPLVSRRPQTPAPTPGSLGPVS